MNIEVKTLWNYDEIQDVRDVIGGLMAHAHKTE